MYCTIYTYIYTQKCVLTVLKTWWRIWNKEQKSKMRKYYSSVLECNWNRYLGLLPQSVWNEDRLPWSEIRAGQLSLTLGGPEGANPKWPHAGGHRKESSVLQKLFKLPISIICVDWTQFRDTPKYTRITLLIINSLTISWTLFGGLRIEPDLKWAPLEFIVPSSGYNKLSVTYGY
jgi:hypothetical protein